MNYYLSQPIFAHGKYHSHFFDQSFVFTCEDFYTQPFTNQLGHDHIRQGAWQQIVDCVKEQFEKHQCKRIYIDLTGQCWSSDAKYAQIAYESFSSFAPTKIISHDYRDFYHANTHVIWFPVWTYAFLVPDYARNVKNISSSTKNLPAMCFNHNAVWHRMVFFSLLCKKNILSKINYSFSYVLQKNKDKPFAYGLMTSQEIEDFEHYQTLLPIVIDKRFHVYDIALESNFYDQCAVNIVTDTDLDVTAFGGKAIKPFIAKQIPVLIAGVGSNQFLTDLGFDMFPDLVPWHDWDSNNDSRQRVYAVADFLENFLQQDIVKLHSQLHDRIENNRKLLYSPEFKNKITHQIALEGL